jgi:long-chain acyl-CoA synthetase
MPNTVQFVVAFYAAQYLGCICSLLNPLHVDKEYLFMINDTGARVLIATDFLYDKVYHIKNETQLEIIITTSIGDVLPKLKASLGKLIGKIPKPKIKDPDVLKWNDLFKSGAKHPIPEIARPDVHDVALLIYTGGTTGTPKGAMTTHRNILSNNVCVSYWTPEKIGPDDIFVAALPFFHSFGFSVVLTTATYSGSSLLLIPNPRDIGSLLGQLTAYKVTYFPAVPTLYIAVLNYPDLKKFDLSSLKFCLSGAAPLPLEVQTQFEDLTGAVILEGYGMTELAPISHANPPLARKPGSVGLPIPSTYARIVDVETGEPLSQGEVGEIVVAGPQVMKGYWERPEETAEALKERDGKIWMHTGDIGKMDEDGYFYIVDRKKDMIIVSGYKVFPRDVEEVLFEHPAVANAAVIGIPDERTSERVKAFIVLKEGTNLTEEEMIEFTQDKLGKYKVPKEVEIRKELPTSAIGKVLRRELRSN